jgi:tRNA-dihydrouridine synthase B
LKIGKIKLEVPVALAPMAGITDLPYRIICSELGCGFTISEMVSAKGLLFKNKKTKKMLEIAPEERPTAIQLFGSNPNELAEAAKIVEASGADIIDFNMGCPVPKIVNNGDGSALMKNEKLAGEVLKALVSSVKIPVTVKFRAGWSAENLNAVNIAKIAEEAGVAAVAVHGRTREQFYSGSANWDIIRKVKENVNIPVFGNGDILSAVDVKKIMEKTNCDGVMIGRGADGNPWIFAEIKANLLGLAYKPPSLDEKFELMIRHLKMLIEFKGEVIACKEMRRHVNTYVKGLPYAAKYRSVFNELSSFNEFEEELLEYQKKIKRIEL